MAGAEGYGGTEGIYDENMRKAMAAEFQQELLKRMPDMQDLLCDLEMSGMDAWQVMAETWFDMFMRRGKELYIALGPERVEYLFIESGNWLQMLHEFGLYDLERKGEENGE